MSSGGLRDQLDEFGEFWPRLHSALDRVGFTNDYIQQWSRPSIGRPKYIKDQIWGMMEFGSDELAIIDSPLLQRMRRIHQLGLSFLTYPSAEHSRFAHTLGVAHVVKRLIEAINKAAQRENSIRAGGEDYSLFDLSKVPELSRSLVHAALLHDIGHLAFSHAGESAFESLPNATVGGLPMDEFIAIFREEDFYSGLSECLSIAICLSPRLTSFYDKVIGGDGRRHLGVVGSFIGGVPHDRGYPGLANLISGAAVDADKIDYLNRDARQCGIPVGVDFSRVFLNSALVKIEKGQTKALSRSRADAGSDRFTDGVHFIVNASGIDTYDELANAKSVLFQRVYLHQTTRNAEQLLAAALSKATEGGADGADQLSDVLTWFPKGDEAFLQSLSDSAAARELADRLRTRKLPKRAFAIFRDACEPFVSLQDIFDPAEWDGGDGSSLADLDLSYQRQTCWRLFDQLVPADPVERPKRQASLREAIAKSAVDARSLLDATGGTLLAPPYVGMSPRYELRPINEVLVREKNSIGLSGQWTKSEELSNADNIGRGVDYIHTDPEWRTAVALATVKVLYNLHANDKPIEIADGTDLEESGNRSEIAVRPRLMMRLQSVCARAGLDYAQLVEDMNRAGKGGFFGEAYRVVPLKDGQLDTCEKVAERFSKVRGERGWRVTLESVNAFVRQFPVQLRSEILQLLLKGRFLGRGATREGIDPQITQLLSEHQSRLVIARFSPNSGSQTGILLEQERKGDYEVKGIRFARSVNELEMFLDSNDVDSVVFVDDQFATGGQAHSQLLQWAGKPREEWPVEIQKERNIDMSVAGAKFTEFLRSGTVRLLFLHGTAKGKARIEAAAKGLGFQDLEARYHEEIPEERADLTTELKAFLQDVGIALLRGLVPGATNEELAKDALGYGNMATVMTTPTGAPSHTITALWCPGVFEGQAWVPLFLRRGYRKALVIA